MPNLLSSEPIGILSLTALLLAFGRSDWTKDSATDAMKGQSDSNVSLQYGLHEFCPVSQQGVTCVSFKDTKGLENNAFGSDSSTFKLVQNVAMIAYVVLALGLLLSTAGYGFSKWLFIMAAIMSIYVSVMWYLKFTQPKGMTGVKGKVSMGYYGEVLGSILSVIAAYLAYQGK